MHGYISNHFCTQYNHNGRETAISGTRDQPDPLKTDNNSLFRIYPNPTTRKFTVELKGDVASAQGHVASGAISKTEKIIKQ
ncbi:MAG: hypothetical protein NTW16_03405 [Bacteroidetes bacterium]|nr:hypothetical protein [Bacteroidota bacterium]